MRDRRIRHLPVVGPGGALEGVLSLTDIVLKAEENGSPALRREVSAAIREILQKRGTRRSLEHNPFFED
jgi:CBS domain-containing protein